MSDHGSGLWFTRAARQVSRIMGHPSAFLAAVLLIVAWAASGPLFGFSDTWQLVINTVTTVATFLMVFLLQCTQNLDAKAAQIKLDELIRAIEGAHNALLDLEGLDEAELDAVRSDYVELAARARSALRKGGTDTDGAAATSRGRSRKPRKAR